MPSNLTTRRKEILTGLCGLAIAVVLLAWGEALANRVKKSELFSTVRVEEMQDDFNVQWEKTHYIQESTGLRVAKPGAKFYEIQFNSLGFRGPELDEEQDSNAIRIAYLGNSTTLDRRAFPDERSWPALTTQKLEEAFPGCRFTYQNAGTIGMSSRKIDVFYSEMLKRFRPDIVVVMTDDRALTTLELAIAQGLRAGPAGKLNFTREQLLSKYDHVLRELLERIEKENAIPALLGFAQALRENQSPEEQARFTQEGMANAPYMSKESLLLTAQWYDEITKEIADSRHVTYVDWQKRVPPDADFFYNFRHFTPNGSALMSEILADELQRSPIFSATMSTRFGCQAGTTKLLTKTAG